MFKRFARLAIAGNATLAIGLFLALPASAQVVVTVNGDAMNFATAPIIQDGRVFVPLRGVFQRLGASVDYSNGRITATGREGREIALQIGSTDATISGQPETIDVAPFIVGDSTFVPLRFISQALGASVNWNNSDRVVSIRMAGAPDAVSYQAPVDNNYAEYADYAPPPIPAYDQPFVPAADDIWQPGYWAWSSSGYYWVPGTWVEAPQPGYLWTPGYWAWNGGHYGWNSGYWAVSVGFYGGVNYGAGYYGNGYVGGRWDNGAFRYNTYVTRVNTTIVKNVYIDRTVYVNNSTTTRVSYNGGPHGLAARPTAQQVTVAHAPHLAMTPVQTQHVAAAAQDRRNLATVNHNHPPVVAVARPLSASNPPAGLVPVKPADRVAAPAPVHQAPAAYAAPAAHAAPAAYVPLHAVPATHVVPATHAAPPAHVAPAVRPVPAAYAPPVRTAPAAPVTRAVQPARVAPPAYVRPVHVAPAAPAMHTAPVVRAAPVVHAAPAMHAAPAAPAVRAAPPARAPHAAPKPKPTP